ncbi:MAG: hypothetical protein JKY95_17475, partial [Planctomycetaceae bacterium]|nr:hypothetical protein [Planctomycetaceae bacterium]
DCGAGKGKSITQQVRGGEVGLILDARGRSLLVGGENGADRQTVSAWVKSMGLYDE